MFEVFKIFQTVDLVSENVRNRRDGSVQPSCARASQSQGVEDIPVLVCERFVENLTETYSFITFT